MSSHWNKAVDETKGASGTKGRGKKGSWKQYIGIGIMLIGGGFCGYLMAWYMDAYHVAGEYPGNDLLHLGVMFLLICAAIYVQIILHEAGHLLFGLITGYRFSSFRVGSVMLVRQNGKWCLRKMKIAGTGGQCLMAPPDRIDGRIPVLLYNFGGAIMNVVASVLFLCLWAVFDKDSAAAAFCLIAAAIGLVFAAMNGIPLHMGAVDNDGYNALSLSRDPKALGGFWLQLKVNDMQAKGMRLRDMPSEWFAVPSEEDMKNSMMAPVGVFAANRLMDEQRFEEADVCMEQLLNMKSAMAGVQRYLLLLDRLYCELIHENRSEVVDDIWDKNMKKFARSMKGFPSVIRTEYVLALLYDKDEKKAEQIRQRFEKEMKRYPYPGDAQMERELMEFAKNRKAN